ncbi:MAG TPA: hypothetical protein VE978_17775 [Chitinophagales bacterium]|nr:hypothetical protein [Chitinophagales bacterium]
MQLSLQYPAWYFLLCILLGALASFLLYYRDKQFKELGAAFRKWVWLLAAFRFLAVSFLAFLLLSPLIRTNINRVEKPIVVLLQDNSQSVGTTIKKNDSLKYVQQLNSLEKNLSEKYDVKTYSFGSALDEGLKFSFNEKTTNISSALDQIANIYTNQNLGAVILATDGIYNEGSNPAYLNEKLHAPVYTIGLGDTTVKRDLILTNVYYNRTVFLGDYFPIKAEWHAQFCPNEKAAITLKELSGGNEKILDSKEISIQGNDDRGSNDFLVKAGEAGLKHYRISLSMLSNEASELNNAKDVFVEVEEKKEKVLILANAPHPDVAALKQTIEETKNYRVDVNIGSDYSGNIKDYSLIIFNQLPAQGHPVQSLLEQIHQEKKSVLFIAGAQTSVSMFNNAQQMLSIEGNNNSTTDALPVVNGDFTLFNLPDIVKQNLTAFPPLQSPFGEYRTSPGAVALFNQKIGNITTKYPLILFQQDLDGRTCVIAGEGLWRWRMWDYLQHKNQDAFNALISSVVQYLAVRPDERQFRVRLEKEMQSAGNRIFSENESVVFDAELLNESNELINDPDVTMTVKDEGGKEFPFIFSKTGNTYTLNAGFFQQGSYSYLARTSYNNKNLTASGTFSITPTQLEFVNMRADHQLLYLLSGKTGGKLFYPSQLDELAKAIQSKEEIKPVLYSTTRTEPLINLRWLIIPILLLLAIEWGIRKFNGGY